MKFNIPARRGTKVTVCSRMQGHVSCGGTRVANALVVHLTRNSVVLGLLQHKLVCWMYDYSQGYQRST